MASRPDGVGALTQSDVAAGSELQGDDDAAGPYQISHAAWMTMMAATDHLTCLEASLFQTGPLNPKMHLHI